MSCPTVQQRDVLHSSCQNMCRLTDMGCALTRAMGNNLANSSTKTMSTIMVPNHFKRVIGNNIRCSQGRLRFVCCDRVISPYKPVCKSYEVFVSRDACAARGRTLYLPCKASALPWTLIPKVSRINSSCDQRNIKRVMQAVFRPSAPPAQTLR